MTFITGNFNRFGASVEGDLVTFTFAVSQNISNVALRFYDVSDFSFHEEVSLKGEDCHIGLVYSVAFKTSEIKGLCYLIVEDGTEHADPYSKLVKGRDIWADTAREKSSFKIYSGIPFELNDVWKDERVKIAPTDMIMYKLHMRGFTCGANCKESTRGNYKGLINRLSYLKKLGVTSLELMPVYDFEELFLDHRTFIGKDGTRKKETVFNNKINYWGYGDAFYMAPKASYFGGENAISSFRKLVSAIHGEGMECILEMAFEPSATKDLIIDTLEYYVRYFHIDGFHLVGNKAPIEDIVDDPFLGNTKIFYEYIPESLLSRQKGDKHLFIYNDSFMYVGRQIQNHMNGSMVQFANHMRRQNDSYGFVNYMSVVNGFTLWDSYSYGEKHNQANGEENRDGNNCNYSCNYGVEGKTNNKAINALRFLHMRNAFAMTFLSQSVPLIVAADEVANTNQGNNNPYCQDNEVGYSLFTKSVAKNLLFKFVTQIIEFRKAHKCIRQENAMEMTDYKHVGFPDLSFHGSEPWMMSIGEEQKALGVLYSGAYADEDEDVYICYNFHYDEVSMALPLLSAGRRWRQVLNTATYDANCDLVPKPINNQQSIKVPGSSITVLVGVNVKDKKK
ncbi:MAG: glycogen operon protein GlgX [Pseudobutyrivibrio sp.]|nr:glycogen operon protein GlgX [Pseudobutyrivibrio sp.]